MDTSVFHTFKATQRVMTVDGIPGQVTGILEGPYAGDVNYDVVLDNDLGRGQYTEGQLRAIGQPTATTEHHVASDDYPEMGSILWDRPPIERTAAKPRRSKNFPYGKRNGVEITDQAFPGESGLVRCDNCGKYHAAEYSHEGKYGEGPIHAVICPKDNLTDYYTNEVLEPREAAAGHSNEDEPQDPTSMTDPFAWAPSEEDFHNVDLSRQMPATPAPTGGPAQMPDAVDRRSR
jgi:hypothetical protein